MTSARRVADQPAWWRRIAQDQRRALTDVWWRLRSRPFGTLFTAFVIGVVLALPAGLDALIRIDYKNKPALRPTRLGER